jgi:membrane protease YdiL (CAAX protease family)
MTDGAVLSGREPMTPQIKLWDILLLMIQAVIAELVVVLPLQALHPSRFVILSVILMVGSIWWMVGYQRLARTRGWASLLERFGGVERLVLLASALGGVLLVVLPGTLVSLLESVGIKIPDFPAQAVLPSSPVELPLALVTVVVLGPLSEELIFRGLLLDWLRQKMAVWPAAMIISLLFALLHDLRFQNGIIFWIAFAVRFLLGMGASYFVIRYRSLRASFVMHAMLNACACLASVVRAGA